MTGVGIFNTTNNSEQNQAQEKQDVSISPKPNMSIPLKPTPTEWWGSLEAFKQEREISEVMTCIISFSSWAHMTWAIIHAKG